MKLVKTDVAELAHSFLICSCVYFCLYGPFNSILLYKYSLQLSDFSLCCISPISALLVFSTLCLLVKVSFSRLGSKHQLTKLNPNIIPSSCQG